MALLRSRAADALDELARIVAGRPKPQRKRDPEPCPYCKLKGKPWSPACESNKVAWWSR